MLRRAARQAGNTARILPPGKLIRTALYHLHVFRVMPPDIRGLHLGSGDYRISGFWNIDGSPLARSDLIGGLGRIKLRSESVSLIYASHVFEHAPRREAQNVLREWFRVLKKGGALYICVPDVEALFRIYLQHLPAYDLDEGRHRVDLASGIVFGGQVDRRDYHYAGYSIVTLKALLRSAGFESVERFDPAQVDFAPRDASCAEIRGEPVSLNLKATK
jgi:predicted SAM-dependent methyltransferase